MAPLTADSEPPRAGADRGNHRAPHGPHHRRFAAAPAQRLERQAPAVDRDGGPDPSPPRTGVVGLIRSRPVTQRTLTGAAFRYSGESEDTFGFAPAQPDAGNGSALEAAGAKHRSPGRER